MPIHVGAVPRVARHGHSSGNDGGKLSPALFAGLFPLVVSPLKRTGLTALVATTNLIVAPAPGSWRLQCYIEATTVTVPGTFTVTIVYTSANGAQTKTPINAVAVGAAGDVAGSPIPMEIASGNLTYAVAIGAFAGVYNIRIVPEFLSA